MIISTWGLSLKILIFRKIRTIFGSIRIGFETSIIPSEVVPSEIAIVSECDHKIYIFVLIIHRSFFAKSLIILLI